MRSRKQTARQLLLMESSLAYPRGKEDKSRSPKGRLKLERRSDTRCSYRVRVRDFASRIEGLAQNSFGGKTVEKGEMSKQLKDKMILSQFLAGLKPNLKAQMIENPKDFAAAVELGDRIEMAQAMLTPNKCFGL
ncbi:hypothetical protein AVEN_266034-1 [Araneus ventricosus]|uniref:Uncharacterized protein n=1 Tax=Araneus ventricosus TaxID=182803 RepID=A0A4Y2S6K5_ARAVE|nr:hypothetical protein AVEN_266034-1 [Araneus ventricosus]